jgi:hypothetical protein
MKMGTSELTTGELTFNGAIAYPVGPLDRGVANVVGIVLTYSRLTVGLSAAAFMTRAVREAKKYSELREAFGVTIGRFPMVKAQIQDIENATRRTTAGAFRLYGEFLSLEGGTGTGIAADAPIEQKKKSFRVRELIMLQKMAASWDSTDVIRKAMSIFGGHGVMEDFSSLPRLYRDAAINELWKPAQRALARSTRSEKVSPVRPEGFVKSVKDAMRRWSRRMRGDRQSCRIRLSGRRKRPWRSAACGTISATGSIIRTRTARWRKSRARCGRRARHDKAYAAGRRGERSLFFRPVSSLLPAVNHPITGLLRLLESEGYYFAELPHVRRHIFPASAGIISEGYEHPVHGGEIRVGEHAHVSLRVHLDEQPVHLVQEQPLGGVEPFYELRAQGAVQHEVRHHAEIGVVVDEVVDELLGQPVLC